MKIYLIGMPGSGKTTIGEKISRKLSVGFVDLDKEIELKEGNSVSEIFASKGEDYFRRVESTLLAEWASDSGSWIMATGGGAPCFFNGIDVINQSGISIFLDETTSVLVARLAGKKTDPCFNLKIAIR